MFAVLLTLVGIIVFVVSLITTKFDFKTSLLRLMYCTVAGVVIDCLIATYFIVLACVTLA